MPSELDASIGPIPANGTEQALAITVGLMERVYVSREELLKLYGPDGSTKRNAPK